MLLAVQFFLISTVAHANLKCVDIYLNTDNDVNNTNSKIVFINDSYSANKGEYVVPEDGAHGVKFMRTNRDYASIRQEWKNRVHNLMGPSDPAKLKQISEILDLYHLQGKKILDAGTGDGAFVEDLRLAGVTAIGLDLALRSNQREKDYFVEASIADTSFPPESFDLIISSYSLFHYYLSVDQPLIYSQALMELHRILKPGGKLVLVNANYGIDEIMSSQDFKILYPVSQIKYGQHFLLEKK
jgi:SAM-dependent methyltransferase